MNWFAKSARDLPWRRTEDPYAIWISEMMLQQTTVATVVPYFEKFLRAFPNVQALAAARPDDVLRLWEGLGYYSRARYVHTAAQMVVNEFGGVFPNTRDLIARLPGIGAYSAGSILSIAFRKPEAALDGNLIRVYARLFGWTHPVDDREVLKALWEIARAFVPKDPRQIREFTEGMMELGALVCRPRQPTCGLCPVHDLCVAHQQGLTHMIPVKRKRRAREKHFEKIYLSRKKGQIAFLPTGADAKYPRFQRLPFLGGGKAPSPLQPRPLKYSVTHRDFFVQLIVGLLPTHLRKSVVWKSPDEVAHLLLPAIDRRILSQSGEGAE